MSALVCSSVFVFGSPYSSKVPAGWPSGTAAKTICGTWTPKGYANVYFHVEAGSDGYLVRRITRSGTGSYFYRAWTTDIEGATILNLKDGEKHPEYMLYKLDMEERDRLLLTSVSALNEEQFTSPGDLRKYLELNIDRPGFLDMHDRMIFNRVHGFECRSSL